jgi:hypothetical protein
MALKEVPGDIEGTTGSVETIQIVPGQDDTVVTIASVFYGTDANGPISIPLNADNKSFSLTILSGSNMLQVSLFDQNKSDGSAIAQQVSNGSTNLLEPDIEFVQGVAVWSPIIVGT